MSNDNTFQYTYRPAQNQEVLGIRAHYLPEQEHLTKQKHFRKKWKTAARYNALIKYMKEVIKNVY